jgi:hypothetical protein
MSIAYELIGRRPFIKCIEDHSDVVVASLPTGGTAALTIASSPLLFGHTFCEVTRNTMSSPATSPSGSSSSAAATSS